MLKGKKIRSKHLILAIQLSVIIVNSGCKKLVEVNSPTTSISAKNVYTNDLTASAVLTGLYTRISARSITGNDLSAIGLITGISGDELTLYSGSRDVRLQAYYQNNLKTITSQFDFWTSIYNEIYIINSALDGLEKSKSLTPSIKQQLLGEAKFMRAFCYFYLVNLYGDVPLATTTDYTVNNILSRTPQEQVWALILSDLKEAQSMLTDGYLDGTISKSTTERVRPNKWAATALLARSYLYRNDWKNAEIQATEVINYTSLYKLDSLNGVFRMNSPEAIWQLQPVNSNANTEDAKVYIIPSTGPSSLKPVYLSQQILNSFENEDHRKLNWIDTVYVSGTYYYYAYKYKSIAMGAPITEYNTILRLAEEYLIRAESRTQQNNFDGALDDLNVIRERAGLKKSKITEKGLLLATIYHERQVELFTEWGHRWLDLKRTQRINTIMTAVTPSKGGLWGPNAQLFPIPSFDIISNENLKQNPGY